MMKRAQLEQSLRHAGARRQRGFTLVEMMVAVTIGLVVILGVTVTFVQLKGAWGTQDKLSQLQDNERLAMAFLTSAVEEAGYYPDPTHSSPIPALTTDATYGTTLAGQVIVGTSGTNTDTLSTIFATAGGDGLLTCQGSTFGGSGTAIVRNTFYVDTTTSTLKCKVDSPTASTPSMTAPEAALVTGVASMTVLYNVNTSNTPSPAYQYLPASSMTGYWGSVKAVQITLNFVNPNGGSPIPWVQTVNLMNNQ